MVGHTRILAQGAEVSRESSQRRAVGQKYGEVIEPEPPPPGYWRGPGGSRMRTSVFDRAGPRASPRQYAFEGAKTQDAVVIRQRAAEIARLEHDRAEPDVRWQTVAGRRNGEVVGGHLEVAQPLVSRYLAASQDRCPSG